MDKELIYKKAVEKVGKQFELGNYFLPELIMAGEMLKKTW